MADERRARLEQALADAAQQLSTLARQHEEIVASSRDSNADDEHDPEGATIAFERQQVLALRQQVQRTLDDLRRAIGRLENGKYGRCESCGGAIAVERLVARPTARTCISCAARRR